MRTLAAVAVCLLGSHAVFADPLPPLSLLPPFEQIDSQGQRTLGDWSTGGMAEVKQNYIRLTPDRAVSAIYLQVLGLCALPSSMWS